MKPSQRNPLLRNFVLAASFCLTFGQAAHAASVYWDTNGNSTGSGAATGTWGASAFWTTTEVGNVATTGTLPSANDDVFIAAGTNGTAGIITIDTAKVAGSLTLQEPALNPGVIISGGTSLTLGGGSTVTKGLFVTGNGVHTVSTPLILNGANTIQTGGQTSNLSLTVNGGITGTGDLTLRNNSTGTSGIQLLAAQINTAGTISNTGTNTGTVILGNAASTTGTGGLSTTVTSVSQDSATSTLQFLNANNSAYAGNYNINAGTLQMAGTNTGPGTGTNLGTITATNSTSVFNLGATSGTAAATLNIFNNAVSGKVNNDINVRAGSTGTKSISVNTSVNFTTTGVVTLDDHLTLSPAGAATFGITFNGLIKDGTSGAKGLVKAGAGDATLTFANTYSGATSVTAGNLILSGSAGALPNTSGITIFGGSLRLGNTLAANSTNRIPDSTPISINAGTLNFSHNAGAASYSETVAVTASSSGAISTSQAVGGQTSVLTIGTFTRSPGSVLTFSGTGLGSVDSTNRILFTTPPTTLNGVLPWATYGTTGFASYDGTNGIIATTTTDIDAQGSTIANVSTSNLRITADGTGAAIALGATDTTINTLVQANISLTTTPTIDAAGKTLRLNGLLLPSTASTKGLTIGANPNEGTLTAGTAGGELLLTNNSASGLLLNAVIADNATASIFTKAGSGTATFAGTNTYTGGTSLTGGIAIATNASAFGSGTVTVNPPTTRLVVNDTVTLANNITFKGGGASSRGVFENSGTGEATLSGIITIDGPLSGGGHFASATGGTLRVNGAINSASQPVISRLGTVIFSGGGSYSNFTINEGTVKLGAANGLSTSATADVGASATSVLDLAGFDQTLVGITRSNGGVGSTIGNSSTATSSILTVTGTSTYAGVITNVIAPGDKLTTLQIASGANITLTGNYTANTPDIQSGGTLTLGAGGGDSINPSTKALLVPSGATLRTTGANRVQNDAVLTVNGTFDQSGQADTIGYLAGGGSVTNYNALLTFNMPLVGSGSDFSGTLTGTASMAFTAAGAGGSASSIQILSGANDINGVSVSGGRLIGRNAAAFGVAGKIVTVGASALTLDPTIEFGNNAPLNSYVLNIGSGNTGTVEMNRATAGAALTQPASASTLGNGTLNFEKGANVTSGTPVLEFASLSLSAGVTGFGAATLNPTGVDISVLGGITRPGSSAGSLKLDGTSTGNVIAGAIQDNGANKLNLTKQNTSTWTLGGTNTYTGTTTITGGTLALSALGSIDNSPTLSISAGAELDTTAKTSQILPAAFNIGLDGTTNTSGLIDAAGKDLVISGATLNFNETGTLTAPVYVLANYATITGTPTFASVESVPGYNLVYNHSGGTQIALVRASSAYDTWGAPYGLATGSEGGDLDNDGLVNQQEFAFGLIPNDGSSVNPILVQLDKTTGQFTYQRLTASGLTYSIWTSPDLATWTKDTAAIQTPTTVGANQSVLVTLSATPKPLTATKLFVRVAAD